MIFTDNEIIAWAQGGGIAPFCAENVNPASIDLTWSGRLRVARPAGWSDEIVVPAQGEYGFQPNTLYLLDTAEYVVVPEDWAGMLMLKSSIGRSGLEHLHAGYFDPGFEGTATLEVKNMAPWVVRLRPGQRIVQIVFMALTGKPRASYRQTGRYGGQRGPTVAR